VVERGNGGGAHRGFNTREKRGGQSVAATIRLQRKGTTHMAFFRIVVADSRCPRDGRFVEQLGYYDPLKDPATIVVDTAKAIAWLGKGAQPSETVRSLFARVGIMQTWSEMKKGKSLDELLHIEDDARKRIDAQAGMKKRKQEAEGGKKAEAATKAREAAEVAVAESAPPSTESEAPATGVEEAATEPKA